MAVNVAIRGEGWDELVEVLNNFENFRAEGDRFANRVLLKIERQAKIRVPVRTGRLRASIYSKLMGFTKGSFVSTNTDYAIYVHEGTDKMINRPFMDWAVDDADEFIEQEVDKLMDSLFR